MRPLLKLAHICFLQDHDYTANIKQWDIIITVQKHLWYPFSYLCDSSSSHKFDDLI